MIDKAAPWEAKERYVARIVSLATGHCWLCDADASLSSDPERTPGAWRAAPVTIAIDHREGCGAVFDESDRALFPVYSGGSDR
ncbi:MAG: hypothetical protein QOH69_2954 [Actinomycetota bacterium]|nr:hypothetical protein [Actinomycetota bacterium]